MKATEINTKIEEIIRSETGIVINKDRFIDLDIVIRSRLIFHSMEPEKYINFLKHNHNEIIFVASCFTIQETSFYRYKSHYDRLKLEIIPELILKNRNNKKSLSILSAGCATGEEPYTISMIINDLINDIKDWEINIIATDINENALKIADEAVYSEYKLRNIDEWYKNRYFSKIKDGKNISYKINDAVKKLITFKQCNLIREPFQLSFLNDIDIIFCENVIIYFCNESIQRLVNNFYNILKNDGYLFLGYSETLNFIKHKFQLSWWNDSYIYKKSKKTEDPVQYHFKELIRDERIAEDSTEDIHEKSYKDIINLIIRNFSEGLDDNVATLLRKIDESDMEIDEIYYIIKAEFKFNKKDYINSTNECRKAININPQSVDAHIILGAIYLELNMLDSAAFEIKTALYMDPNSILANFYYSVFNKKIKNETDSIKYLEKTRALLNENRGLLKNRLFPIHEATRKDIYDKILNNVS